MKNRRTALIAVCLIVSLFVFQHYFLEPQRETIRNDIERESATLDKYQRVLRNAPPDEAELAKIESQVKSLEKRLIPEKSDQLASAKIQSRITELATKSGFTISTIKPGTTVKRDPYRQVPVYFEGSGTIKSISAFLKDIEQDPILFGIDKLGINITSMQNPRDLKMKIQISGLIKP